MGGRGICRLEGCVGDASLTGQLACAVGPGGVDVDAYDFAWSDDLRQA